MRAVVLVGLGVAALGCGRRNFNDGADAGPDALASDGAAPPRNVAFVTSSVQRGTFGGLAGADAICQARADEAGLPGTFLALLSDSSTSAVSRLVGARGWVRTDGKPVADLPSQLTNHTSWYPVALDESGVDLRNASLFVWSGTQDNGAPSGNYCEDWAAEPAEGALGTTGSLTATGVRALTTLNSPCDVLARLYCFQTDHAHPLAVEPTPGRLAFLSSGEWSPAGGITAADAVCTSDARNAGYATQTFLAALPETVSTQARFDLDGPTWVRRDGVPVVLAAAAMFSAGQSEVPVILDAAGAPVGGTTFWSGMPLQNPTISCEGWQTAQAPAAAYVGEADSTRLVDRFAVATQTCESRYRLLCLEN